MTDMEIKEKLMEEARRGGICADGYGRMRGYDREELIDYYVRNPDWCLERGFPSLELLRREFSDLEDRGIFVGKTFAGEELSGRQAYVFHACRGRVNVAMDYMNAVIPMLYFANGCNLRVECRQRNNPAIIVPLYVAEGCKIAADNTGNCVFRRKTIKRIGR